MWSGAQSGDLGGAGITQDYWGLTRPVLATQHVGWYPVCEPKPCRVGAPWTPVLISFFGRAARWAGGSAGGASVQFPPQEQRAGETEEMGQNG